MSKVHIVIARYKEDDHWLQVWRDAANTQLFVYDKSPQVINPSYIKRPNRGREVGSFIEHIITHYDNLPEYTVFMQCDPFPHMHHNITVTNIVSLIQNEISKKDLQDSHQRITEPLLTTWHLERHGTYPGICSNQYFEHFFDTVLPPEFAFAAGCQYLVPKAIIQNKPKEFYTYLHSMILLGDHYTFAEAHFTHNRNKFSPVEINGWTLERIYGFIFSSIPIKPIPKRYLVTGGAGFIGSNLVEKLIEENHLVYIIDNLSTGFKEFIPNHLNLYFLEGDILTTDLVLAIGYVDGIFHLAAMSKVAPSLANMDMVDFCFNNNLNATVQILKYAAKHSPPVKVIYSASSTYYGNNPIPQHEGQLPDCQTPYALSKYAGELTCRLFSQLYGVPTVCLRYFMVFGTREPHEGAYAIVTGIFLKRYAQNLPLEVHGDGSQSRDFIHVQDIVKANILAMCSDLYCETINLGPGECVSIKTIAEAISSNLVFTAPRKIDLKATQADTTKLQCLLGFVPTQRILKYIKTQKDSIDVNIRSDK